MTTNNSNPALDSALHLLSLGMALVHIPRGKKGPCTHGWNLPENHITTPEQARQKFARSSNVGVILGASHLISVDVDREEEARKVLSEHGIDLDELKNNHPHPIQGRGSRYWYRIPDGMKLEMSRRHEMLINGETKTTFELRASDRAQDVAPGSLHPLGMDYVWTKGPPSTREDLPIAPDMLIRLHREWPFTAKKKVTERKLFEQAELPPLLSITGLNAGAADVRGKLNADDARQWINARYSVSQLMQRYGVSINAAAKCSCVFPNHLDRDPSMHVTAEFAYCFVCDRHLDAIGVVQHFENLNFRQAVLAMGYRPDPATRAQIPEIKAEQAQEVEQCHGALAMAAHDALIRQTTETATQAMAYLADRGFSIEDLVRSTIGVIDETVPGDVYPLTRSGKTGSDWCAKWLGRITIPQICENGRVSLKARSMTSDEDAEKYLTAPGTGCLELFNLISWIDQQVERPLLLVEGELDCLSVISALPDQPVAALPGLHNLKPAQVKALKDRRVIILLDPDCELERTATGERSWMTLAQMQKAELRATIRAGRYVIETLREAGCDVRCIPALPQGDVNAALQQLGRERLAVALAELMGRAVVPVSPSGVKPAVREIGAKRKAPVFVGAGKAVAATVAGPR